jgi:5-hydroxyisourate hydrolase
VATDTDGSAGRLTTHVLDTALGLPARGLRIELYRIDGSGRILVKSASTNGDGRCGEPLLAGPSLERGIYELNFHVGDYLRQQGTVLSEPAFLDEVPIRFGIHDEAQHYHVPLLVSPFGFTTYRGS